MPTPNYHQLTALLGAAAVLLPDTPASPAAAALADYALDAPPPLAL